MAHQEFQEQLVTEALGWSESDDDVAREAFWAHLRSCSDCRRELESLKDALALIALSASPVNAPAELRTKVLRMIQENRIPTPNPQTERPRVEALPKSPTRSAFWKQFKVWTSFQDVAALRLLAACFVFAATGLGIALYISARLNHEMHEELARVSRDLRQVRDEALTEQQDAELLASPDARIASLKGTGVAPQAAARFAFDNRSGRGVLYTFNLPPAPVDRSYELWLIADGKPWPSVVFNTSALGQARAAKVVPPEQRGATAFAITLEPRGGSAVPSGDRYLVSAAL